MEIASIQSLSGSSPGSGFNPAADLKQLDDMYDQLSYRKNEYENLFRNGAIINLEMCKKISSENRRVESQGYSTVLQRERDEREQLRQRAIFSFILRDRRSNLKPTLDSSKSKKKRCGSRWRSGNRKRSSEPHLQTLRT